MKKLHLIKVQLALNLNDLIPTSLSQGLLLQIELQPSSVGAQPLHQAQLSQNALTCQ
jgi:hypothetical protein